MLHNYVTLKGVFSMYYFECMNNKNYTNLNANISILSIMTLELSNETTELSV